MPWKAISYVSSGLTLIAFIIAIVAWVIQRKMLERESLIRSVPESDRASLVERTLEFFDVDTSGLTERDRYKLALRQVDARATRFRTTAIVVIIIASLAAGVTTFALWQEAKKAVGSAASKTLPTPANSPSSDPSRLPKPSPTCRAEDRLLGRC